MKVVDMAGCQVGRLTVLGRAGTARNGQALWKCRCNCGNESVVFGSNLRRRVTRSCGCLEIEVRGDSRRTHGLSRGKRKDGSRVKGHELYEIWCGIRRRCLRTSDAAYPQYGGRGIRVHPPWVKDFVTFLDDLLAQIGHRPSPAHSLDRIDNDGHYEPSNVRWATAKEQAENRGRMTELVAENVRLKARVAELETGLATIPALLAEVRRLRGLA